MVASQKLLKLIERYVDNEINLLSIVKRLKAQAERDGIAPEELENHFRVNYPHFPQELLHA